MKREPHGRLQRTGRGHVLQRHLGIRPGHGAVGGVGAGRRPARHPVRFSCSGYDAENDLFYISHGFTNSGRFDDTWSFDLATDSWTDLSPSGDRPVKRCLHQCFFDGTSNQLALFGGQSNVVPILGDLWKFDVGSLAHGRRPSRASQPLCPASTCPWPGDSDSGEFFLYGGLSTQGKRDDLWAYSSGDGWSDLGSGNDPGLLTNHASVYLSGENTLYVFGGLADGESNTLWRVAHKLA